MGFGQPKCESKNKCEAGSECSPLRYAPAVGARGRAADFSIHQTVDHPRTSALYLKKSVDSLLTTVAARRSSTHPSPASRAH
jgi:hypothetical protein